MSKRDLETARLMEQDEHEEWLGQAELLERLQEQRKKQQKQGAGKRPRKGKQ